jgi:hypothetical protein
LSVVLLTLAIGPRLAGAQSGVLFVENDNVGVGIASPLETLHIRGADGTAKLLIEESEGDSFEAMMELSNEVAK